jgi:small subunit ribosomal protein S20
LPAKAAPKKNKSAMKRARQSKIRALKNRSVKSKFKTLLKKVESEVANKNVEGAKTALNNAISVIDRAAGKGVIHKNTASRKISRLTRLVNSLSRGLGTGAT